MESFMNDPWIETYTGKRFYYNHPNPDDIDIEDIAHALSMICRFTGHTIDFYSVAEHSCFVASLVEEKDRLGALLHDATEAYLQDISRPLKSMSPQYQELEDKLRVVIEQKFGLDYDHEAVDYADKKMCEVEATQLMPNTDGWDIDTTNLPDARVMCMEPLHAEVLFLKAYNGLMENKCSIK